MVSARQPSPLPLIARVRRLRSGATRSRVGRPRPSRVVALEPAKRATLGVMTDPIPGPEPALDPNEPIPDDPGELLPDADEPLPPPPIEATPSDPGGDPGNVPEPA